MTDDHTSLGEGAGSVDPPASTAMEPAPGVRRRPRKRASQPDRPRPVPRGEESVVVAARVEPVAYWQPASRFSDWEPSKLSTAQVPTQRDRSRLIAAVIVVAALLVACGLYLLANMVVADQSGPAVGIQTTEQDG